VVVVVWNGVVGLSGEGGGRREEDED
jgi:hypothetical protein